jgi:hypothetical protein
MTRSADTVYADPLDALGMCAISATEFSSTHTGWGLVRVTGLTYPGREHWASLFAAPSDLSTAMVRDGTMRQFSTGKPALWKGSLDDWLDDMSELLVDHLRYECFETAGTREAFYVDEWVREDVEPGEMSRPQYRP